MFSRDQGLDQQAVDRSGRLFRLVETGEIHLRVPSREQLEVDLELR